MGDVPDSLLVKLAGEIARIGAVVDNIRGMLEDNGQPGIITRFYDVESAQKECRHQHERERIAIKEAAEKLESQNKRREVRIITACVSGSSLAGGIIMWALDKFF